MAVMIAIFVSALYLNNERIIENISNARKERAAAIAGGSASDMVETAAVQMTETAAVKTTETASAQIAETEAVYTTETAAVIMTETAAVQLTETASAQADGLNFLLYDRDGAGKNFSDYRGNVAVIVFWTPWIHESIRQISEIYESLNIPNVSVEYDAAFISVCVPNEYTGAGFSAQHDAELADEAETGGLEGFGELEGYNGLDGADGFDELEGSYGLDGHGGLGELNEFNVYDWFDEFYDADAELANLFMLGEYPSIYVFSANGELSDYQKGYTSAARIERMLARAR